MQRTIPNGKADSTRTNFIGDHAWIGCDMSNTRQKRHHGQYSCWCFIATTSCRFVQSARHIDFIVSSHEWDECGGESFSIHVSMHRLGTHLLSETKTICQLIAHTLRWTSSGKVAGFKRPFSSVRQAAYRTLVVWCKVAKSGSLVELISDDLIKHIIQDVTPYQGEVTLQVLSGSRKYLSKKARQRLHKAQNDASNIVQTHSKAFNPHNTKIIYSDSGNETLCVHALNALAQFILVAGCFLKPVHHKILHENIVGIALKTIAGQPKKSNLYHSEECRRGLYTALYALVISPHHLCPPPVQYAARVFSVAQVRDSSTIVRDQCADYLRAIEKLLHPKKETFYFPTEANEVVDAFKRSIDRQQLENRDDASIEGEESDIEMDENLNRPPSPQPSEISEISIPIEESQPARGTPIAEKPSPQIECSVRLTDIVEEMRTPRKSARLMSPSSATNSGAENDSPSPTPRRKSARLNSISIQETTEKATEKVEQLKPPTKKSLQTIDETPSPVTVETLETTPNVGKVTAPDSTTTTDSKSVDDLVNEMVSAFVDELVEDVDEN